MHKGSKLYQLLEIYIKEITHTTIRGDAREESYYSYLSDLLSSYAKNCGRRGIHITVLPKKTEAGNPDFRIWDGQQHIVGYIEAKSPGADLEKVELSEQLLRYLGTFPNVILTDFHEFRLYRNGKLSNKVTISRPFLTQDLKLLPPIEKEEEFASLLDKFYSFSVPKVYSSESLAVELAKRTRFLRDEVLLEELEEDRSDSIMLGFYEAFQKYLIAGLSKEEFADLYAQTITYGLFAARTRAGQEFNRKLAYEYIPSTIGILRDVFSFVSLGEVPLQMEVIIDDIAEILQVADVNKILTDYYRKGRGDDPIIHFYETFLKKYDPYTREKRGVYYTPEPIVNYIVKSINEVLINDFGKEGGFANTNVTVLDPAGGTLTFLAQVTRLAIRYFVELYGEGGKNSFIKEHILNDFYAFELMMAPYAIAHLKMSFILEKAGYRLEDSDRFKLYLTNTLELEDLEQTRIPGMASLSQESKKAGVIKKDKPILVILGNPPYSQASYNKSDFITDLMKLYKEDVRDEKNIQILDDDYAKFIRFCHWKLQQSGTGVIGLITKNTYLNTGAFKGMRKHLLEFFDKVYVLNLHGKLYEKTPEGDKDDPIFDIRVGTAILLLVKDNSKNGEVAKLYYKDIYGRRHSKHEYLEKETVATTVWEDLPIDPNHYFFEKKLFKNKDTYDSFFSLTDIFITNNSGVQTGRDHFILADSKDELKRRLQLFIKSDLPIDLLRTTFDLPDQPNFKLAKVKNNFKKIKDDIFYHYAHKPFYRKVIYYDRQFLRRHSGIVMDSFILSENVGLVLKKRHGDSFYNSCFVTQHITDLNFLGGQSYVFPLYTHTKSQDMFSGKKRSNISQFFLDALERTYTRTDLTEELFYYIYAILYSNQYRRSFSELLKIDFPKIPFPKSPSLFNSVVKLGRELADLHLMKSSKLDKPEIKFYGDGDNIVHIIKYDTKFGRLYINEIQFFDNISPQIWEFEVGNNRVVRSWIKRKKDFKLSLNDTIDFCKVASSIKLTLDLQDEIDKFYQDIINDTLTKERLSYTD